MSKHVFCRDLCLERDEPLEGMGHLPERVLMLAWPRGKWRTPRWESVDMEPALAAAVHDASHAGLHVALVDKVGETDTLPTLMAQPESVYADFDTQEEIAAAIRAYVAGEIFAGSVDPRITILCCTDSRRDACCARYGFSTYKAMTAIADPSRFNIVQATHLGGCRFAASLVVLPQRQRYGRMTAGQAPGFLRAILNNDIFLPTYKGRADQPEPVQVAEIAAMRWAEENHAPPRRVRMLEADFPQDPEDGETCRLDAEVDGTRLAIRLKAERYFVQGNCEIVAGDGGKSQLRWCLDTLTADQSQTHCKETA